MLGLQDIVKKDETLDEQTPIELVNNMTVAQVRGLQNKNMALLKSLPFSESQMLP